MYLLIVNVKYHCYEIRQKLVLNAYECNVKFLVIKNEKIKIMHTFVCYATYLTAL